MSNILPIEKTESTMAHSASTLKVVNVSPRAIQSRNSKGTIALLPLISINYQLVATLLVEEVVETFAAMRKSVEVNAIKASIYAL